MVAPLRFAVGAEAVACYEWPAGEGAPTLLALHGLGHAGERAWHRLAAALGGQVRLVTYDQPGLGASAGPLRFELDAALAVVDAVAARVSPDRPFALAGHSYGGLLASLYAAAHPHRVSHLIVIDSAGYAPEHSAAHLLFQTPLGSALAHAVPLLRVYARSFDVLRDLETLHAVFARFTGPVLGIWGAYDAFLNVEGLRAIERIYDGATTVRADRSGHGPHLEQPGVVAHAIAGFLPIAHAVGVDLTFERNRAGR